MRRTNIVNRARRVAAVLAGATMFQIGPCNLESIEVTQTIETQQLLIDIANAVILDPIEAFVTNAINNAFGVEG